MAKKSFGNLWIEYTGETFVIETDKNDKEISRSLIDPVVVGKLLRNALEEAIELMCEKRKKKKKK